MEVIQDALEGLGPARTVIQCAHVLVDTDLPHLDKPLNYEIPAALDTEAQPGRLVRIHLAGRRHTGWILSRSSMETDIALRRVDSVVSRTPIITEKLVDLARRIGDRNVATISQVFSLAIPHRVAGVEKELLSQGLSHDGGAGSVGKPTQVTETRSATGADDLPSGWSYYPAGEALIHHLAQGESPRAVWTALPPTRDSMLVDLVRSCLTSGRDAIVVVPTADLSLHLHDVLSDALDVAVELTGSAVSDAERYRVYLNGIRGVSRVIVGTRSAVWTPMRNLGLIVVWDDGDDRLMEQRAPRCDALDVAIQRSILEDAALVTAAWSRSVKAHALAESGWAVSLTPQLGFQRSVVPRINVFTQDDAAQEGPGGYGRLPSAALRLVRRGLDDGPVLIQVASAGYLPVVSCQTCRTIARCSTCSGPLSLTPDSRMTCGWCAREAINWTCPRCGGHHLRSVRVGSERTAQEIARALNGTSVLSSTADHRITHPVDNRPVVVVATAGAEPPASGGYAAGLILDAQAIAGRPELWAPEEAARRWFNACALLRPHAPGLIVGRIDQALGQAFVRWDPVDIAHRLLDERRELGFFPAATIVALDGPAGDVHSIADSVTAEILGTVEQMSRRDASIVTVRTLLRVANPQAPQLLTQLAQIQRQRAATRSPLVKITVNPPELF
ncbi:primosomal protein N [Schaalia sp. ZJ1691]|uniref:primosomal protein N' family DNA-binding protein n=1 Tax=Schaalia sp. ZJ1691 TaxID=2709404 RepID=UPI0013EE3F26|nr:primosomal protein N [Schaalia sp. ZJ1691]